MKKIRINWKKTLVVSLDVIVAVYLLLAVTSWNKPDRSKTFCQTVDISIEDEETDGFLSPQEVKTMLQQRNVFPKNKSMPDIDVREMEDILAVSPFIENADVYKTEDGNVHISLTQRTPVIRIKANNGDDYYVDNRGGIMPNTKYVANLIICTGDITRSYAKKTLFPVADYICSHEFWKNQVVQLNVLPDHTIEMVPRVGEHIVYLGNGGDIESKLDRLYKFYKYGLSEAGWNKYKYISVEFSNQIICKKK